MTVLCTLAYDQGIGEVALISSGGGEKVELTYVPLLTGRTVKGIIFGGVRIRSDLPKIVENCINKVNCLSNNDSVLVL